MPKMTVGYAMQRHACETADRSSVCVCVFVGGWVFDGVDWAVWTQSVRAMANRTQLASFLKSVTGI